MKHSKFSKYFLIVLLAFLSLGAIYGGLVFVLKPDGSVYKIPVEILKNSPFNDFLVPGIILLTTFGLLPIFVVFSLIKKTNNKFFQKLNLLNDYHFSWTFSVYIGVSLVIWINVQTFIFNAVDILHTIYSTYGLLIICIALLPSTRIHYKL